MKPPTSITTLVKVISLAQDESRRNAFRSRAVAAAIAWSFFDAHTTLSNELVYDPDDAWVHRGRTLTHGELGCYSSHYALWRHFLATNYQQLLVLEDDTLFDWYFIDRLIKVDFSAIGIEYLRLFSKSVGKPRLIGPFLDRYLIENVSYSFGTQAYLLTRAGVAINVESLRYVQAPIDDTLDHGWRGRLPTFTLHPSPVIEITGASRIGARARQTVIPAHLKTRRLWFRKVDRRRRAVYRIRRRLWRTRIESSIDWPAK
jgi:glycosyl transferase family 25